MEYLEINDTFFESLRKEYEGPKIDRSPAQIIMKSFNPRARLKNSGAEGCSSNVKPPKKLCIRKSQCDNIYSSKRKK